MLALWMSVAGAADWNTTIDKVIGSVMVLRYERTRAFDGQSQSTPQASGFVVDAERGIILSNRHVVGTAPQVAHALFPNQEEIRIEPLYSDPIHDFGFYRYDPTEVELNQPISLPLDPSGAKRGAEIRLIGNDAGEQISILDATISRIDRPAPWWDMNAFYVQAASDSSGGSSGSPVFDVEGHVVALNAGGRVKEATSYYLRLERVKRALAALQKGEVPSRGTAMVEFVYRPYDELERLGLSPDAQKKARADWKGTGMLIVATVARGGPAEGKLEPGDILLTLDGQSAYGFPTLEAILDDNVGKTLPFVVERGGERVETALEVADLHAFEPNSFLTFLDGSFHEVAYRATARNNREPKGVIVAKAGDLLRAANISSNTILERIDGRPIQSLDTLQEVLTSMKIGQVASVVYSKLTEPNVQQVARIRMTESVRPNERCTKEKSTWSCNDVPHPTERLKVRPAKVLPVEVQHKRARSAAERLVTVSGTTAFPLNTMSATDWRSAGLVIDTAKGLVLTDRYAVPSEATRVTIEAGDSGRIPATIEYLDPLRNVAVVRYDPSLLDFGDLDPLVWSEEPLDVKASYFAALMDEEGRPFSIDRSFSRFAELSLSAHTYPKYRADNLTTLKFGSISRPSLGGVVVDKKGRIIALYQHFRDEKQRGQAASKVFAVPTWPARGILAGQHPLYSGIDLRRSSLAKAREAGVPDGVLERIRAHRTYDPEVMEVWRADRGLAPDVRAGDFIVAIDGAPIASFQDFQQRVHQDATLSIVRDGKDLEVKISVRDLDQAPPTKAVIWAGALIQEEHMEVSRESGTPPNGVYVSWYFGGTPAQRYGLHYGQRILAVNNTRIDGLDAFLRAVEGLEDGQPVRLTMQSLRGRLSARTLRLDTTWWPTLLLQNQDGHWTSSR